MEKNIEFLAIGDIVTEPFIRLLDAEATCDIDEENCKLCVRFGDKVPYESAELIRAVGNSANAAVSAARLGVKSYLMSYIGDDEIGKGNLEELKKNNVHTDYMVTAPGYESNFHYVLWYGVERTILVKHTEFPYSFPMDLPPPKWIYFSSLAANTEKYHGEIAEYLVAHPEVKLVFQPGTFQMKLGVKKLKAIYEHTTVFSCNVEEAERILKAEGKNLDGIVASSIESKKKLMDMLTELGPKQILLTDGIKGAYAYDGEKYYFMPVYPHEPFERTGAGDAFTSTFASALVLGKSFAEALTWAPINAMSVTLQVGAQKGLLSREKLEEYIKNAPEDYKVKEI